MWEWYCSFNYLCFPYISHDSTALCYTEGATQQNTHYRRTTEQRCPVTLVLNISSTSLDIIYPQFLWLVGQRVSSPCPVSGPCSTLYQYLILMFCAHPPNERCNRFSSVDCSVDRVLYPICKYSQYYCNISMLYLVVQQGYSYMVT